MGDRTRFNAITAAPGRLTPVFCRGKPAPACDPPGYGHPAAFLHDLQSPDYPAAEPGPATGAHPDRERPEPGHQAPWPDPVSLCWWDLPYGPSDHHCVDKIKLPIPPVVSGVLPPGYHESSWKKVTERASEGNPIRKVSRWAPDWTQNHAQFWFCTSRDHWTWQGSTSTGRHRAQPGNRTLASVLLDSGPGSTLFLPWLFLCSVWHNVSILFCMSCSHFLV